MVPDYSEYKLNDVTEYKLNSVGVTKQTSRDHVACNTVVENPRGRGG